MEGQSNHIGFLFACLIKANRASHKRTDHRGFLLSFVTAIAIALYSKEGEAGESVSIESGSNHATFDLGQNTQAKIVQQGEHGTAKIVNGKVVYTSKGKAQNDTIKISVTNANGKTEIIDLDISVSGMGSTLAIAGGIGLALAAGIAGATALSGKDSAAVNYAPQIVSSDTITVEEGQTTVVTVTANDPEFDTVTYSIQGGEDAAKFQIDSNTGALSFINAPDFDNQNSFDGDDIYEVTVGASDGSLTTNQSINVTVSDLPISAGVVAMSSLDSITITGLTSDDKLISHGDVNNDGFEELIFYDESVPTNKVLTLMYGKNFSPTDTNITDYTTTVINDLDFDKVTTVDIDGDSKTDILGYNNDGSISIILGSEILAGQVYANASGFSTIDLAGLQTNSDLIGHTNFNNDQYQDFFLYDSGTNSLNVVYGAASPAYSQFTIAGLPAGVDIISTDMNMDGIEDFVFFDSTLDQISYVLGNDAYVGAGTLLYNNIVDGTLTGLPTNYSLAGHIGTLGNGYSGFYIYTNTTDDEFKVVLSDPNFTSHTDFSDLDILSMLSNFSANENIKIGAEFNGNNYFELITQDDGNGNITLYYQFEDYIWA